MTEVSGDWLTNPATQRVMALLEEAGHKAFVVGGCVRNALLGVPVSDVDISTDARPKRVITLAKEAGLKALPTGIDHGTVTVIAGGAPFEVTTFRADVETDGRRAVVRFTDQLDQDAIRRDFTMNALYADRRGKVIDPLGGLTDLADRRFRFIQDAETRIREDYLRTLRYFRFFAWYGDPARGMDADALAAIAATLDGLETLSKERVTAEICKLLAAPDPLMAVAVMEQVGVLARLLPGAQSRALGPLLAHESTLGLDPDALRRLAALGVQSGDELRLSKTDQKRLSDYAEAIGAAAGLAEIAWRNGPDTALDIAALRAALLEQPLPRDVATQIANGVGAKFPISAKDLMPELSGKALGDALKALETRWIASDFSMAREELMTILRKG